MTTISVGSQSIFFFAVILISAATTTATDHIVGGNKGWNPGINYTLWANNQTIYVGDYISFRYQKSMYDVFMVNKTGYDNCTTEGAIGNWTSGKDFIMLNKTGRYYFICGNGQCFNGLKVSILVHALPPPPSGSAVSNVSSEKHSSTAAKGAINFRGLATLACIWFGCLWIWQ